MALHNAILKHLSSKIHESLKTTFSFEELTIDEIFKSLQPPPNIEMGHFAFACFPLAKALRNAPPKIAIALKENIKTDEYIEEVVLAGPYLNFKIQKSAFGSQVVNAINSGSFFEGPFIDDNPRTMVEYSQPNTHKVLHVGHMRNLCLGNALIRTARYLGKDIVSATYPGDMGTHVAKCLWYLKYHEKESAPKENSGAWLGQIYVKANHKLEDELGSEKEETNRRELTAILTQLHDEKGEFFDLWKETKEWSFNLMKEAYDWADVEFDRWFSESEVDAESLSLAKKLHADGLLKEDQGAIGLDLSEEKLGFCILIKSDGTGLYSTKDVMLAKKKFEEFGIKKNIYIVDNRQAFHFKQVFKVLEKMGFEEAKDCYHLQYDVVELPDGAMSSRKGNIIPLMDLISKMESSIKEQYLAKYAGDWTEEEINQCAKDVANGAIKYGMIRIDNNRKIVFDMNEWLKLDGETGPYLQYVHARIHSMTKKIALNSELIDWNLLVTKNENELLIKLNMFNQIILQASESHKTASICSYLYELGKLFNSFYAESPIAKAESEALTATRLALTNAVGKIMKQGLACLGIPVPNRM